MHFLHVNRVNQKCKTPYEGGIAYLDFSSSPPVRSIFGYGLTILYVLRCQSFQYSHSIFYLNKSFLSVFYIIFNLASLP